MLKEDIEKLSKEEANKLISEKLKTGGGLITECQEIADFHKLSFRSPLDVYGMGGWYDGDESERDSDREDGWRPSSHSC